MTRARIRHLDGIRGYGMIFVLLQHWAGQRHGLGGGYVGLDLFLVLSGYIITITLVRSSAGYRTFLWRRVLRLYPPLVVAVAVGSLLCAVLPFSPVGQHTTARSAVLALTQLSSPGAAVGLDMRPFGVTWSLAIEWYFYLLWPLAVLAWKRRGTDPRRAARICAVAAVGLFAASLPLDAGWFYFGPVARFAELLAGAALAYGSLARADDADPVRRAPPGWLAALALLAVTAWVFLAPGQESFWSRVVGVPLAAGTALLLIAVGEAHPRALTTRFLAWKPLAGLGVVTYSMYLWHAFPLVLVNERTTGLPYAAVLAVFLATTAVTTALAYGLVERPAVRLAGSAGRRALTGAQARGEPAGPPPVDVGEALR